MRIWQRVFNSSVGVRWQMVAYVPAENVAATLQGLRLQAPHAYFVAAYQRPTR
jgi:hypothetical protein